MASPPRRRDAAMLANGAKLMLIGVVLAIVGFALLLFTDGTADGIGIAFVSLGAVPFFGGLALWGSGFVSRRARQGKPFA